MAGFDALYLHVPFCFHKCHYCDFYSIADCDEATGDKQARFTDALTREIRHWGGDRGGHAPPRPTTVFVGGGTPTLLRPELWSRLLAALREAGMLDRVEEFTVEANPETLTPDLLKTLTAGGVNRLSIGAQTFQPRLLKALERWHDPASVPRAVELARAAGVDNVNLDLIFAVPGQRLDELDADLDAVLALAPEHVSSYGLTYEPNTTLGMKLKLGRVHAVDEDRELAMYRRVIERLGGAGFEHYETSNFARPGRRCEHNLRYWRSANYLGLGPSASSHVDGRRWKNEAHLGRYVRGCPTPPRVDEEALTETQRIGERLMLGLRLREGVDLGFIRDHIDGDAPRAAAIADLRERGYLEYAGDRLRLTDKALPVADAVIAAVL